MCGGGGLAPRAGPLPAVRGVPSGVRRGAEPAVTQRRQPDEGGVGKRVRERAAGGARGCGRASPPGVRPEARRAERKGDPDRRLFLEKTSDDRTRAGPAGCEGGRARRPRRGEAAEGATSTAALDPGDGPRRRGDRRDRRRRPGATKRLADSSAPGARPVADAPRRLRSCAPAPSPERGPASPEAPLQPLRECVLLSPVIRGAVASAWDDGDFPGTRTVGPWAGSEFYANTTWIPTLGEQQRGCRFAGRGCWLSPGLDAGATSCSLPVRIV